MAHKFVLVVALVLCAEFLATSGQSVAIFPAEVSGQVGESVTIFCVAGLVNEDNSLELQNRTLGTFINYETSTDGMQRLTRVDDQNNATLTSYTISPLRSTDNGAVFRCGTTGGTSTISVIFAPIITRQGQEVNPIQVTEGEMDTIGFDVSANPAPSFVWTRNGESFPNGSGLTANAFSIILDPANRTHVGMYRLEVSNSVGTTDYNFTLDVLFGPEFPRGVYIIPSNLNNKMRDGVFVVAVTPGQSVTLVCNATGNPAPSITYNIPQGSTATTSDVNIDISGAASGDAGSYSCTAGNVVRGFEVFVGGVPQPVQRVNVTIGSSFANVTWDYDDSVNGVPATYFIGNVTRRDNGSSVVSFRVPASERRFPIPLRNFTGETQYEATLVVRNLQGDSEALSGLFETPMIGHGNILVSAPWSIISLLILAIAAFY